MLCVIFFFAFLFFVAKGGLDESDTKKYSKDAKKGSLFFSL